MTTNLKKELGGAEPAADGLAAGGVVADDFDGSGDGDGEDESNAAPEKAPEKKSDGDGERVEVNAAADHRREENVGGDEMEDPEHGVNTQERRDGVIFAESHESDGSPGHDHAEVGNEIEDAGNERGEKSEVETKAPEEEPTGDHENESDHGSAHHVATQNIAYIVERVADFGALGRWK